MRKDKGKGVKIGRGGSIKCKRRCKEGSEEYEGGNTFGEFSW
jgi:hypothetical protein